MKLAVLALSLSLSVPALAGTVTTPINGSLANGGLALGTLTFDTSVNPASLDLITAVDFNVYDGGKTYTFDDATLNSGYYQAIQTGEYYVAAQDGSGDVLMIGFQLSQLAGAEAGTASFCAVGDGCDYTSAFITPNPNANPPVTVVQFDNIGPAPEPSSLVLLGTGILGIAGAARRRFVRA